MPDTSPTATTSYTSLHNPSYPVQSLLELPTPDGSTRLDERQARYAAIVIDFFQARGTMAKMNDYFVDDAIYEDLFATCKNREEVGEYCIGAFEMRSQGRLIKHPSIVQSDPSPRTFIITITNIPAMQ
jgi:hypothetical protein